MSLIQILQEVSIPRLIDLHGKTGYIVITAFRNDFDLEENYRRNKVLKRAIDASGYSYFPVWGGFVEVEKDENDKVISRTPVKEKGFLVTNFKRGSSQPLPDSEELKELGIRWTKLLKPYQDSVLYVPGGDNKNAFYLKPDGSIDMKFDTYSSTKIVDEYFTTLNKSRGKVEGDFTRKALTFREE
jgi:hypothetical protein